MDKSSEEDRLKQLIKLVDCYITMVKKKQVGEEEIKAAKEIVLKEIEELKKNK